MKYAVGTAAYVVVLIAVYASINLRIRHLVIKAHGKPMWDAWK